MQLIILSYDSHLWADHLQIRFDVLVPRQYRRGSNKYQKMPTTQLIKPIFNRSLDGEMSIRKILRLPFLSKLQFNLEGSIQFSIEKYANKN